MHKLKRNCWPIALILAVAFIVRVWGIRFGLPYAYHVDESRYISAAIGMLQTKTMNPGWFLQPTLYTYLITLILGGYYLYGAAIGEFQAVSDLFRPPYFFDGLIQYPSEFLLARLLTVLFGVATVWLVYKISRPWIGAKGALTASAFLAVSIFHVTASHFIATDVPMAFFVLGALFFVARLSLTGQTRYYIGAGILTGLAIGTKYSAFVLFVPMLAAHLAAWRHGRTNLLPPAIFWMGLSVVIAFFLTTPYALITPEKFVNDVYYEWEHNKIRGHIGAEGNSGRWMINQLLTSSDRWLTITALIGFTLAVWRRNWPIILTSIFCLAYFYSMATTIVHFERFLVPLIPALAVGTGCFFAVLYEKWGKGYGRFLIPLLTLILLLEPTIRVIQVDIRLAQPDVRTIALDWITTNLPPGVKIAREQYTPNLDNFPYDVTKFSRLNENPPEWYAEQKFNYLIFAEARYGVLANDPERYREEIARYQNLFDRYDLVAEFNGPYVGRPDHAILVYKIAPIGE